MKKTFFSWAFALTAGIFLFSCSGKDQPAATTSTAPQTEAAADTAAGAPAGQQMAYICPMECAGSASMEPGKCPVCGMDLIKNQAASADSANVQ